MRHLANAGYQNPESEPLGIELIFCNERAFRGVWQRKRGLLRVWGRLGIHWGTQHRAHGLMQTPPNVTDKMISVKGRVECRFQPNTLMGYRNLGSSQGTFWNTSRHSPDLNSWSIPRPSLSLLNRPSPQKETEFEQEQHSWSWDELSSTGLIQPTWQAWLLSVKTGTCTNHI